MEWPPRCAVGAPHDPKSPAGWPWLGQTAECTVEFGTFDLSAESTVKILGAQPPTREQLRIISEQRLGVEIIRGAAGSGKTTTALLRLKNLSDMFRARHRRLGIARPVRVLVLTYNRTLCGYVQALASKQVSPQNDPEIEVDTFAGWALSKIGRRSVPQQRSLILNGMREFNRIRLPFDFIGDEVEYILGRFPHDDLDRYLDAERTGRGQAPRVDRTTRQALLDLIAAYTALLMRVDHAAAGSRSGRTSRRRWPK